MFDNEFVCPKCGDLAREYAVLYQENGDTVAVVRAYQCDCGNCFKTGRYFHTSDSEEVIEGED